MSTDTQKRRSAFTYWEIDAPSRIDFGKQKYGGPFTNEQVEDVKAMFRLILLIVSLFGFYLSGDGYSFSSYLMKTMECPTLAPFALYILNPQVLNMFPHSLFCFEFLLISGFSRNISLPVPSLCLNECG